MQFDISGLHKTHFVRYFSNQTIKIPLIDLLKQLAPPVCLLRWRPLRYKAIAESVSLGFGGEGHFAPNKNYYQLHLYPVPPIRCRPRLPLLG